MSDLISRQDAIDAVEHITSSMSVCVNTDECHGMKRMQRQAVIELANLPSTEPDIDEFLRNKSPKEHREILHWIAVHYYPRDSKEVLQAVSNMIRPDTNGGLDE